MFDVRLVAARIDATSMHDAAASQAFTIGPARYCLQSAIPRCFTEQRKISVPLKKQ